MQWTPKLTAKKLNIFGYLTFIISSWAKFNFTTIIRLVYLFNFTTIIRLVYLFKKGNVNVKSDEGTISRLKLTINFPKKAYEHVPN